MFVFRRFATRVVWQPLPRRPLTTSDDVVARIAALAARQEQLGGAPTYPHWQPHPLDQKNGAFIEAYTDVAAGTQRRDVQVHIAGRILSKRPAGKKLVFYDVESGGHTLQVVARAADHATGPADHATGPADHATGPAATRVVVDRTTDAFATTHHALRRGDIVRVCGHAGRTQAGELSVYAHGVDLLAPCLHDLPLTLRDTELRARQRHVDMLVNKELRHTLEQRGRMLRYLRNYLDSRGFVEVETPTLCRQAGGAMATPFTTRLEALDLSLALRIAPELPLKTLVVGGLDRVYEVGKQFRNEGMDGTHNPEFTTCEFYMAYADLPQVMALTEDLLRGLGGPQFVVMWRALRAVVLHMKWVDFGPPFQRVSIPEALSSALKRPFPNLQSLPFDTCVSELRHMCAELGLDVSRAPQTPSSLLDKLIGHVIESKLVQPTFLLDHPLLLSPLAKSHPQLAGCASRCELFVAGKELCNAYTELNDPAEQRVRFQAQLKERQGGFGDACLPDEEFCQVLEYGLPPTTGWGLGLDRLLMILLQKTHIRDVLAFPLMKPASDN